MSFIEQMLNEIRGTTENGAVGYVSTGKNLLDMNFAVSSMRKKAGHEITAKYERCLNEDVESAVAWLFFARDVRGGMGERRLFRLCMVHLAFEYTDLAERLLPLVPVYGRWDDVLVLLDTPLKIPVVKMLRAQLKEDWQSMQEGRSVSLLAKWMPSENASSFNTRCLARQLMSELGLTPRTYRKTLSALRRQISLVEQKMSDNEWGSIEYPEVPSRANLKYHRAFARHDPVRRNEYLESVNRGEAKMNAAVLFPHEIVHRYQVQKNGFRFHVRAENTNPSLEAMWRSLSDPDAEMENSTLVVADGSGSMWDVVDRKSSVTALDVATAMAIWFSERLTGPYRNLYVTFSERPQFVDLRPCHTLAEKLFEAARHTECANTNVEAVFDLILETAVRNQSSQEDLPRNVLIISDMEFDACTTCRPRGYTQFGYGLRTPLNRTLFQEIEGRFRVHGYQMPRLVFWNVNSRTGTIPVKENELGVALVSGFSPNVASMVMSGKTDPSEILQETLRSERYTPVRELVHAWYESRKA